MEIFSMDICIEAALVPQYKYKYNTIQYNTIHVCPMAIK
jgi:hypothetical protein